MDAVLGSAFLDEEVSVSWRTGHNALEGRGPSFKKSYTGLQPTFCTMVLMELQNDFEWDSLF